MPNPPNGSNSGVLDKAPNPLPPPKPRPRPPVPVNAEQPTVAQPVPASPAPPKPVAKAKPPADAPPVSAAPLPPKPQAKAIPAVPVPKAAPVGKPAVPVQASAKPKPVAAAAAVSQATAKPAAPAKSATAVPKTATKPRRPEPDEELLDEEEFVGRATRPTWQMMLQVYGFSTLLHAAVLLVMWFIILPQEYREEILSMVVEQEEKVEPPPVITPVIEPEVLEDESVEDNVPVEALALVKSEIDAQDNFNLNINDLELAVKTEAEEGPSLPIPPGDKSAGRSEAARATMLAERGGNAESDAAVARALEWLASVQRRNGSWDFIDVGQSAEPGNLSSPTGATGLALMAFLGAGHTHDKDGKYKENVYRGLDFLMKSAIRRPAGLDYRGQSPGNDGMYVQAIVTTALTEAYGMTKDRRIYPFAEGATMFICLAQHSGGGWRYKPNQAGDTSVVGWQVMALKSAYHSEIKIPRTVPMGIRKFLDDVSHEEQSKYSYTPGQAPKASTTAIGLLCRMYMGWQTDNPSLINGVKYLAKIGPSKGDIYYDYYASQVMIQFTGARGELWDKWNTTMRDWLVETQRTDGPEKGSWDVIEKGHKGSSGGRLYTTCLAVMSLEIYYRVLPLYKRAAVEGDF